MSNSVWYSQLFENTFGGGAFLALPFEALADWDGEGDEYDEMIDEIDHFLCKPLGSTTGVFITDDEGIHEAHWMRFADQPGVILVVWIEWDDPSRPAIPEDMKQIARAWNRRQDPRQSWLEQKLRQCELVWERQGTVTISSGVLLLLHAEGPPLKSRFPKPRAVAKCGHAVPVGITPGDYQIETLMFNELPEGAHWCLICRWTPA